MNRAVSTGRGRKPAADLVRRRSVAAFLLLFPLSIPAAALDEAAIEGAIKRGVAARSAADVPALIRVGEVTEAGTRYAFFAGSCRHWIENRAFAAHESGVELDREAVRDRCLGRDELQVAVAAASATELDDSPAGPLALSGEPVTDLFLRLDGRELRFESAAAYDRYGRGSAFGIFAPVTLSATSEVLVFAALGSGTRLSLRLKKRQLSRLL